MAIKPDIIISWPRNCDYPLWRQFVRDHREQFNEIIVVFTETNQGADYRQFVRDAMFVDHVLCIESDATGTGEDWRNLAIHSALLHSYNAPWILFTEQDFFPTDFKWFWSIVEGNEDFDAIGVQAGERMHPCFLLIKREALNRTRKQFGIVTDKLDHFGLIQEDIENPANGITFTAIPDSLHRQDYIHMNGLSHNMTLMERGEDVTYKPEEFTNYLRECLEVQVPLDNRFVQLVKSYLEP